MMEIFKKFKRKILIDSYDKTCHLLNLRFHPDIKEFSGTCSLCGAGKFLSNKRYTSCRAKNEDDTYA